MPLEYYELKKVTIPDSDGLGIATAAFITCGLCGKAIDSMGGPGNGPICIPCGDIVKSGHARGAIKWDE